MIIVVKDFLFKMEVVLSWAWRNLMIAAHKVLNLLSSPSRIAHSEIPRYSSRLIFNSLLLCSSCVTKSGISQGRDDGTWRLLIH